MTGAILDHSLDAERAVLGAAIMDGDALEVLLEMNAAWFFLGAHQEIARAAAALVAQRRPVDPVTLTAEVGRKIPDVVPADMIWALARGIGSAANARHYAAEVRKLWALRQARVFAARFASNPDLVDPEAAIGCLQRDLASIECGGTRPLTMLELSARYVEELQRDMADPGARTAFDTGYTLYDKHTGGLRPGVLTILAGRPGNGKTAFVMGMIAHLARTGVPVAAFWLEDDWHDAVRRYHQARNYVPAEHLRGNPLRAAQVMNDAALRHLDEQERIFIDDSHGLTANEIAARMRRLAREKGVRVFFADHLGEMRVEREDRWGDRHDLAIGKAARLFRDTAKEIGAAPVLVSQMNRQIERRSDGAARMSDLDGSGQVEQAARVIAFLSQERDSQGEPTTTYTVDLAKNTNGRPGVIHLRWVPDRMAVENGASP